MNLSVPQLQALAQAATLAPSSHNTQPWLFWLEGQAIELLADRTRALPVNDPDDRELTISSSCALLNLRVAAAAAGLQAPVEPWPDAADTLATLRPKLQQLTGNQGHAQLLLRIGATTQAVPAAPRRPVADVLVAP